MSDRQYVSFRLDDRLFGIDILFVREIIRNVDFTPVETAPASVRGLLNLRGQIITVIDPSFALGLPPRQLGPGSRCIILKTDEELSAHLEQGLALESVGPDSLGLLVDGIADVAASGPQGPDPLPANTPAGGSSPLSGVLKLEGHLLTILAPGKLLASNPEGLAAPSG